MSVEGHAVRVVRIGSVLKHPGADKLEIIPIPNTSYQAISVLGQFRPGDLAIYVQPDSVIPQTEPFKFIWDGHQEEPSGLVREKYRRIKARRLRKEWSEGLLMPVTDFPELYGDFTKGKVHAKEGDDVAAILGITHYEPEEDAEYEANKPGTKQSKFWPRSLKGWLYFLPRILTFGWYDPNGKTGGSNEKAPETFRPIYDVESYKNFPDVFQEGETVVVTEKIHGSNARFTYVPSKWGLGEGKMYAGSRKLWKSRASKCIWREALKKNPWIKEFCEQYPDYTLYGEVVPTQTLKYGCAAGDARFYVFDIRTPEGYWIDKKDLIKSNGQVVGARFELQGLAAKLNWVPILYYGPWTTKLLSEFVDGKSTIVGADHIREGIVICPETERESHIRGLGRAQVKVVSNQYLEKA